MMVREALGDIHYDSNGDIITKSQRYHDKQIAYYTARAIVDKEAIFPEGIQLSSSIISGVDNDTTLTPDLTERYKTLIADIVARQRQPIVDKSKRNPDGSGISIRLSKSSQTVVELVADYKHEFLKAQGMGAGEAQIMDTTGTTDNADNDLVKQTKDIDKSYQSSETLANYG